jgi:hypothetical protein
MPQPLRSPEHSLEIMAKSTGVLVSRVAALLFAGLALASSLHAQSASAPPNLWLTLLLPDSATSGGVVSRVAIRNLPVDDPRQALVLVPGVALHAGEIGVGVLPVLSIRGAATEPQILVDGVPMRLQTFGTQGFGLDANALDAAVVLTGVAPVTIPDAGAGVIAYRTRAGGDRLDADVRWSSDEPFGDAMSAGFNHITGAAGGPLGERLRFAASATLIGQRSQYRGSGAADVPVLVPSGIDTVVDAPSGNATSLPAFVEWDGGSRRPFDWTSARRVHGRFDYAYGAGSALSFTVLASDLQQRSFPMQRLLAPQAYEGERFRSAMGTANLRHALPLGRVAAVLDIIASWARESDVSGALAQKTEVTTRNPYLGIELGSLQFIGADLLPSTETLVRNVRTNSGVRTPFLNREDLRFAQPHRTNPYGMLSGWPTSGLDTQLGTFTETRLNGRAGLEISPGAHRVTIGVDAERSSVELYTSSLLRQAFMDVFAEHPTRIGLFAADRVALSGAAKLDVGMRFDRYAPGGEFPKTPGRIYSNPGWSPNAATADTAYTASVARVFRPTRVQSFISPQVRFTIPVAARAVMRLGYRRAVEPPAWSLFFRQVNADLDFTNASSTFGRDVSFVVASLVELAARVELSPGVSIDAALFRRDGDRYVARILPFADPLNPGDTINISALTKVSDNSPWGVESRLEWLGSGRVSATLAYAASRREIEPGGGFTQHMLAAAARVKLPIDFDAVVFARAASGEPYTRLNNQGLGIVSPPSVFGNAIEPFNASRLPWSKVVDLRVGRTLRAGGRDWQLFADVRNLFNFRNVRALFAETGNVTNDAFRQQVLGAEFANLAGEASSNSALEAGNTVNLTACGTWSDPVNCVALARAEGRFGDGDGHYTSAEQQTALYAFYESVYGAWRFYGAGRTLRIGAQLAL